MNNESEKAHEGTGLEALVRKFKQHVKFRERHENNPTGLF